MAVTLDQFMAALSGQESGGSYTATNGRTGAYGRFQIMPSNWPSWSREAGLGPDAPQTPENQERVARFKLQQYFDTFGNWEDVAAVWYSGSPRSAYSADQLNRKQGKGDEPSINEYVTSVMSRVNGGGSMSAPTAGLPPMPTWPGDYKDDDPNDPNLITAPRTAQQKFYSDLAMWGQAVTAVQSVNDTGSDKDSAQQDFNNTTTTFNSKIALDQANIQTAAAALSRWVQGLQESRSRAQMVTDAQEQVRKYGTTPGKTEFSYKDLGRDLFAAKMGLDPNAVSMRYGGTQTLDPRGILDSFDTQLGVSGELPAIPGMTTTAADVPAWARTALGGSGGGGTSVQGAGSGALPNVPGTSVPDIPAAGGGFGGLYTAPPMDLNTYPQTGQSVAPPGFDWDAPVTAQPMPPPTWANMPVSVTGRTAGVRPWWAK